MQASDNLIGRIYQAVLEPEQFSAVLAELAAALGGGAATLVRLSADSEAIVSALPPARIQPEDAAALLQAWRCGKAGGISQRGPGSYALWVDAAIPGGVALLLGGLSARPNRAVLRALAPHLRQMVQLWWRLERAEPLVAALRLALDHMPLPVFLLDATGRVRMHNRGAAHLLHHSPVLRLDAGRLATRRRAESEAMDRAVANTIAGNTGEQAPILRLRNRAGRPILALMVVGLARVSAAPMGPDGVAALAYVSDLTLRRHLRADLLARQFDLTPAESRVLAAIAEGDEPKQIAEQAGLSVATVRSQLKSIMAKTEARSQSRLSTSAWRSLGALMLFDDR